ncbi:hypothetical protein B0F90DRAFT_220623 [Multifurca ochricompacta]|uniref:Cytochrome P450 n=1 Tax=Multifurca ochricompacta TaxID=376703 RepID=A0AAD4M6U6_9AGAM|nr:hypothetical protein B0F90DRAFT_220623 [Multifurca ochricompacta]
MLFLTQFDVFFPTAVVALLLTVVLYTKVQVGSARRRLPYPQDPNALPIIGNLFDMFSQDELIGYKNWSDEYGSEVIHLDAASTQIIIVNSTKAANDLLEKSSSMYSYS